MHSILLIEDSLPMMLLMESILVKDGYEVHKANEGEHALDLIEKGLVPDLVITDLHMPVMDGFEFVRQFRQLSTEIPVIMLSVDATEVHRIKALELGVSGWLVKPVCTTIMYRTIENLLNLCHLDVPCPESQVYEG